MDDRHLWIGGSDFGSEGVWKWSDCSDWDFKKLGILHGEKQPSNETIALDMIET